MKWQWQPLKLWKERGQGGKRNENCVCLFKQSSRRERGETRLESRRDQRWTKLLSSYVRYPGCQVQPPCATPSHLCNTQINLCAMIFFRPFFLFFRQQIKQLAGHGWIQRGLREEKAGVNGGERELGEGRGRVSKWRREWGKRRSWVEPSPSPLNDVCRLSNARVNWNTCDCLKYCIPRRAHLFVLPPHSTILPLSLQSTPPLSPTCDGMQISMYVNRMLLAAHLLSLRPHLRLWRRLICIQELYIHMLNGPR